jgi:hypothetical protein
MYAYAHAYAGIHVYNTLVVSLPTPYILVILVIIWPWASWRRGSPSGGWINEGRAVNDNVDVHPQYNIQVSGTFYIREIVLYSYVSLRCRFKTFLFPFRAELTILKKSIDQL